MNTDTTIIGGGVVGLACAALISKRVEVLVIEKNDGVGQETSSRNSQVVHAGIYYPKQSWKGKLCRPGNASLYEWAEKYNVPYKVCGKYIVAQNEKELKALGKLSDVAWENNVVTLEAIDSEELPSTISGIGAVWSPRTGIIDVHALMKSFVKVIENRKGSIALRHKVVGVVKENKKFLLNILGPSGQRFTLETKHVINAAGLYAHKIAEMIGFSYNIEYYKGSYWRVKGDLPDSLVYPVPNADSLGIHLTTELDGGHRLGPDMEKVDQINYSVFLESQTKFYGEGRKFIKDLSVGDMRPDTAGIRPILKGRYDFVIKQDLPGWINLIAIHSPGLTCCIEIARVCQWKLWKEYV